MTSASAIFPAFPCLFLLQCVDQFDGREEAHAFAVMLDGLNARGGCNMRFPGSGTTDQHHILGRFQDLTAMELADQSFAHFTGREVEGGQILLGGEASGFHVIRDRAHLSLGHFGLEQLRQDRRRAKGTPAA